MRFALNDEARNEREDKPKTLCLIKNDISGTFNCLFLKGFCLGIRERVFVWFEDKNSFERLTMLTKVCLAVHLKLKTINKDELKKLFEVFNFNHSSNLF